MINSREESGQTEEHSRLLYAWAQGQFTEEELQRAEQESEEYTLEEVLRHLENADPARKK